MITLYDHPLSGNCHKVRLLLSFLSLSHESVFVDVPGGAHRAAWFTSVNPLQQIPVLRDGEFVIQDSQAILTYLAGTYGPNWRGANSAEEGRIAEWLSFAANEIGNSLQPARVHYLLNEEMDIERVQARGVRALSLLDQRLSDRPWLASDRPTIADIACLPYVALSHEGRLPLDNFVNVASWIDRIVKLPGYVSMPGMPPSPDSGVQR